MKYVSLIVAALWLCGAAVCPSAADEVLPVGAAKPAIAIDHFPDRLHAVVFRNWSLVEPQRVAAAVGATEQQITRIAESMGLPSSPVVAPQWRRQGYITIVRRNWHLLPYEQLLTLLDMTAEELAFALREDDFLFIKLGRFKPICEPVRYREPDDKARKRAAEIRGVVERHFDETLRRDSQPPFAFVKQLSDMATAPPPPSPAEAARRLAQPPRYIYSYFGSYGDPLLGDGVDSYPDGLLARLADNGVNGVWLHVVLRQLAPGGTVFPEFGEGHEERLANLRKLVERARRYGIAVYLYMNEPRAMPHGFFAARPQSEGVREGDYAAMCTSDPAVTKWLEDALAHVFTQVPHLGGVFTITASENLTHCGSHDRHSQCPRCRERSQAQLVAEVNAAIQRGVHRGNRDARVICWDWGWNGHGDGSEHIALLPDNTWLMSVSEWALPIERGGVKTTVGEYSISSVGPGPRAQRHWQIAQQRSLPTVAKVQLNCTWELSAVPWLPVLDLVAEHCHNLAQAHVDGVMLSWSLGGYPSPNLQVAQKFAENPAAEPAQVLDEIATGRYGSAAAHHVRRAWAHFSRGFREYPYHGSVVYRAPQQMGPANLLHREPTGLPATMVGFPYDDLNGWRGPYPPQVFIAQFETLTAAWDEGIEAMEQALAANAEHRAVVEADLRLARAAGIHLASVANQGRFVLLRDQLRTQANDADTRRRIMQTLDDEIDLARQLFDLACADSRIGFEASNHYYYVPLDLIEKVINCEYLRSRFAQSQ